MKNMSSFQDWEKVTDGIYIYPIGDKKRYEIHVKHWDVKNDIVLAYATLYIFTDCLHGDHTVERAEIFTGNLSSCVIAALEDYNKNFK